MKLDFAELEPGAAAAAVGGAGTICVEQQAAVLVLHADCQLLAAADVDVDDEHDAGLSSTSYSNGDYF